jgi:hypothetical protein
MTLSVVRVVNSSTFAGFTLSIHFCSSCILLLGLGTHPLQRFQVGTVLTLVLDHWTGHCYLSLVEEELFMA